MAAKIFDRAEEPDLWRVRGYVVFGLGAALYSTEGTPGGAPSVLQPIEMLARQRPYILTLATVQLFFLNHRLFGTVLESATIRVAGTASKWSRTSQILLSAVPLLGPYLLSLVRWTAAKRPIWFLATHGQRQTPPLYFLEASLLGNLLVNLLAFQGWVAYLGHTFGGNLMSHALRALALAAIYMDVIVSYHRAIISLRRGVFLSLLSLLWLFSWPFWCLGWLGHLSIINLASRPRHRMQTLLKGRLGLYERLEGPFRFDWWRASRWRLWRDADWTAGPKAETEGEDELSPIYRLKTFLTVHEATGMIFLLASAGHTWPAAASLVTFAILTIVLCSIGIVALSFLVLIYSFLAGLFKKTPLSDRAQATPRYLFLSQSSSVVGTYIGLFLISGNTHRLSLILIVGGGLAMFVALLLALTHLLPSRRKKVKRDNTQTVLWMTYFMMGLAAGVAIRMSEVLAFYFRMSMILLIALTPIVALGTGLALGRRLLRLLPPGKTLVLRVAMAFCMVTAFLPLGGVAIPFWILVRRRIKAAHSSTPILKEIQHTHVKDEQPNSRGDSLAGHSLNREARSYFFSNIVSHLATARRGQRTYELMEQTRFLQDQLSHFNGFGKCSYDLETYVIPMALEECDWNRFTYFMLISIHLRGAAEDLIEFIEPLALGGHVSIALDAVNRIASPLDRSGSKAAIASKLDPSSEIYNSLLQSVAYDLSSLPPLTTDPTLAGPMTEKRFWVFVVVAQAFGLAAKDLLARFLIDCPEEWSDMILLNIAQRHAEQNGIMDRDLWLVLGNVRDPALLKRYLIEQLTASEDLPEPEALLARIEEFSDDPEISWLCRFRLLEVLAKTSLQRAVSLWQCWLLERPVCWSLQVAEQATPFLTRLEGQQIQDLFLSIKYPEVRIALLLAVPSLADSPKEMRRAIDDLPPGALRSYWIIRFLRLHAHDLAKPEIRNELMKLNQSLYELKYKIEAPDLRSFFELVAEHSPESLEPEMKRAFWAPSTTMDDLVEVAENTESARLLSHLFENLDHYILPFRLGEAEGFEVWLGLLKKIVPRLCVLTGSLSCLKSALELCPDRADEVRAATVKGLMEAKLPHLAESLCNDIISRRLRQLTRLKVSAASHPEVLNPLSLFEAFADSEMLLDAVSGLQAVACADVVPGHLLHSHVCRIQDQEERFLVLLRAAERALSQSGKRDQQNDLLNRLVQSAALVTSDVQLSVLIPEITMVVASHSGRLAVTEVKEALERLIALRSVPWPVRRDSCETLLARLLPLLSAQAGKGWEARELVRMISGLLKQIEFGSDQEIEERGILPVLFAVMDRLPLPLSRKLSREFPSTGLFPSLYLADDRGLCEVLDYMAEEEDRFDPLVLETVLYLISDRFPEFVPVILKDLTAGAFRDTVAANLLRHGWLPAELAPEVLTLIDRTAIRISTELFVGLGPEADSDGYDGWLNALASILPHQLVDPTNPRNEPWLRKLWAINPEQSRPILARGVLNALAQAGRWHGTSALSLWLHAHLAPDAKRDPAEVLALCAQAEHVTQRALQLPAGPASTNA